MRLLIFKVGKIHGGCLIYKQLAKQKKKKGGDEVEPRQCETRRRESDVGPPYKKRIQS